MLTRIINAMKPERAVSIEWLNKCRVEAVVTTNKGSYRRDVFEIWYDTRTGFQVGNVVSDMLDRFARAADNKATAAERLAEWESQRAGRGE